MKISVPLLYKEKAMVFEEKNMLITSRASSAIYLVLDSLKDKGNVIVPANLCYAGIYPILYAGMTPVFCDVDQHSGNTNLDFFKKAVTSKTVAAIIPHMYGNPVKELPEIAEFCKENEILLIEDCASAMGAKADYPLGKVGDYTVYSTGYSKTLDLGLGGILFSETHSLDSMREKEKSLPAFLQDDEKNLELFSKLYRFLRNNGNKSNIEKEIYKMLPTVCKNAFLHRISDTDANMVKERLSDLPRVIELRRNCLSRYQSNLKDCGIKYYEYSDGAVPWRFCFFISPEKRASFISECLENSIPISDWYPCVMPLFNQPDGLPEAKKHEMSILNLPIPLPDQRIDEICNCIKKILSV